MGETDDVQERDSTMYWFGVLGLCLLGLIGFFSFGAPLLVVGVALLFVAPWRKRRTVVWSTVAGSIAAVAAYVLVAPLGCTVTASQESFFPAVSAECAHIPGAGSSSSGACLTPAGAGGDEPGMAARTECTNVLGIDYSGVGAYRPTLVPAVAASVAVALLVGFVASTAVRRSSSLSV